MFWPIHRVLLVLAALAPIGCATDGGLSPRTMDVYGDSADAAMRTSRATSAEALPESVPAPLTAASTATSSATLSATQPAISGTNSEPAASEADLAALQSQAEDAYRARRFDEALALYERLVGLQPASARAWLRLGNVHHQRRAWFKAIAAYRRASARTIAGVETEPIVRAKAYYNVALVDLELARQNLRSLERLGGASATVGDPAPLAREIDRTQRRLEAVFSRESATQPSDSVETITKAGPPRKADPPTKVDYIRGEPRP